MIATIGHDKAAGSPSAKEISMVPSASFVNAVCSFYLRRLRGADDWVAGNDVEANGRYRAWRNVWIRCVYLLRKLDRDNRGSQRFQRSSVENSTAAASTAGERSRLGAV